MNLKGLRFLNTRPLGQGLALTEAIVNAGGLSIDLPALAIEPTPNDWFKNLPNLAFVHHAIFTSTNAVNYFFAHIVEQGLTWPTTVQTTAIGKASAAELAKWNIRVDHVPLVGDSDHLVQLASLQHVKNQTILLIKGKEGRMKIAFSLLARGANIISLEVYQRELPVASPQYINSLWHDDRVDIILFTSEQAIHNVFILFGEGAHTWLCSKPCVVISERLAKAAYALGMRTIIVSPYDAIMKTIEHYPL